MSVPQPEQATPAEKRRSRRYGLPEEDEEDGWEPEATEDWEGIEAPAKMETRGGQLMGGFSKVSLISCSLHLLYSICSQEQ